MAKLRCKETSMDSFYGRFLYEGKVARDHFLRKLEEVIDWSRFTKRLLRYYRGKGEIGQAPYEPALMLKMLLLSYLYNISERQVEVLANDSLSVGCFLGLGANQKAPDHSTLSLFKERLLEGGGKGAYEELFGEIIAIAQEKGVKFGPIQVVDSTHVIADVNLKKDKARQRGGQGPRDPDARWGAKGNRIEQTPQGPQKRPEYYYGYKDQISLNAQAEMVSSVVVGWGDDYDGHQLPKLVEKDMAQGLTPRIVAADRGYDDGENHYYLEEKGIHSAIRLNRYRTEKKDHNKGWEEVKGRGEYQEGLSERYKVERKLGEAKKWHGFGRCRYIGFLRHAIQVYLTFMVVNLKRLVKVVSGVGFKAEGVPLKG